MTTNNSLSREAFEKWWNGDDDINTEPNWRKDSPVQFAWSAWQAAIEHSRVDLEALDMAGYKRGFQDCQKADKSELDKLREANRVLVKRIQNNIPWCELKNSKNKGPCSGPAIYAWYDDYGRPEFHTCEAHRSKDTNIDSDVVADIQALALASGEVE